MEQQELLDMLTFRPRQKPGLLARAGAFLVTPLKNVVLGRWIGWQETEHTAYVLGRLVRAPVKSTDGSWVLDLRIDDLRLDELKVELLEPRFIRVVVGNDRVAREFCDNNKLYWSDIIETFGPLFIDPTGPYLEIHPYSYLRYAK